MAIPPFDRNNQSQHILSIHRTFLIDMVSVRSFDWLFLMKLTRLTFFKTKVMSLFWRTC